MRERAIKRNNSEIRENYERKLNRRMKEKFKQCKLKQREIRVSKIISLSIINSVKL